MDNYLIHYGILGQKWGIRRYQNPDGSLTEEGQRRYLKGDITKNVSRLKKDAKKAIHQERSRQLGWSNRWLHDEEIGPNGKKLRKKNNKLREEYHNSKEYKQFNKKVENFNKKYELEDIVPDNYDELWDKLMASKPPKNFNDIDDWAYVYGKGFVNDYAKKGGLDISIARLLDLGFNKQTADKLANRLAKKNESLGFY